MFYLNLNKSKPGPCLKVFNDFLKPRKKGKFKLINMALKTLQDLVPYPSIILCPLFILFQHIYACTSKTNHAISYQCDFASVLHQPVLQSHSPTSFTSIFSLSDPLIFRSDINFSSNAFIGYSFHFSILQWLHCTTNMFL